MISLENGHVVEIGDVWEYSNPLNEKRGQFLVLGFSTIKQLEENMNVVVVFHLAKQKTTTLGFQDRKEKYVLISRLEKSDGISRVE